MKTGVELASDFIVHYAEQLGIDGDRRERLKSAARRAILRVARANADGASDQRIKIDVFEHAGRLHVEVLNRGVPLSFDSHDESEENIQYACHVEGPRSVQSGKSGTRRPDNSSGYSPG